jgi:hypothetical protein
MYQAVHTVVGKWRTKGSLKNLGNEFDRGPAESITIETVFIDLYNLNRRRVMKANLYPAKQSAGGPLGTFSIEGFQGEENLFKFSDEDLLQKMVSKVR